MHYDNREEWEIVHAILSENPAKVSPKQIAAFLGRGLQTVYKWGQNPEFSGSPIPKDLILPFSKFTNDVRLLGFYLYQLGYYPAELEPGNECNGEIIDDVMRLDVLRGELSRELLDASGDHKLTAEKGRRLSATAQLMIDELRTFQQELVIKFN